MKYSLLKQLLNKITHDVREFIPKEYLNPLSPLKDISFEKSIYKAMELGLSPDTSTDRIFASRASEIGKSILGRNELLTTRQYAACMLFDSLGKCVIIQSQKIDDIKELEIELEPPLRYFTSASYVNYVEPEIITEFNEMLKRYLDQVETQEAKLFDSLLDNEQKQDKSQTKLTKLQERKNEILRIIRDELGLDPLNLPPIVQGKIWVKSKVKSKLNLPTTLFTKDTFDDAWEKLRASGQLKEEK